MWNTRASLSVLIWQDLSIFKALKRLWEQNLSNTITAPGLHSTGRNQVRMSPSKRLTHSQGPRSSRTRFGIGGRGELAGARLAGHRHRSPASRGSSGADIELQPAPAALRAAAPGSRLLISLSPRTAARPGTPLAEQGERLCSGKGDRRGRRRVVGRGEREKRKEKPTKKRKKVREERGGPEGGGGIEEEQTEMEWGALIQFGSFSYFSYPFSSVQSFVSAFKMLCLTGSLSQISYHLKPLGSERWRPRKGSKWVYQCFFTPRELLDTKERVLKI